MDTESSLGILITGTGRSGTTFLTQLFLNTGYDVGDLSIESIGAEESPVGGGLEYKDFSVLNTAIRREMNKGVPVEEIAVRLREQLHICWPSVLKDPQYCFTWPVWEAAGLRPKHVVFCVRTAEEIEASVHQTLWTRDDPTFASSVFVAAHNTFAYCLLHNIPCTHVLYPRIGTDRAYAEQILSGLIVDPWPIIASVWDPSMCHHSSMKY